MKKERDITKGEVHFNCRSSKYFVPTGNVIKLRAVGSILYYNNGFKSVDEHAKFWARAVGSVHINFIQALKCVEPTALIPSSRIFQRIKIRCFYISRAYGSLKNPSP